MEIAKLIATYQADTSDFESGNRRVQSGLEKTAASAKTAGSAMSSFGQGMQSLGTSLTVALTAPIAAVTALGIKFNATKEQALIAFKVLLKDGEAAKKLFADLQSFADKTPFESPEVINSAKMLKAYGFEVKDLLPLLTDAGNLASGMGVKFEDVARVFGRLKSGDFGEAFERLRDFGISREQLEGEGLKFDSNNSFKGSAQEAMVAVRNIIKKNFDGMMDEQSNTFSGRMSTLWDKVGSTLGKITEPLFNAISKALPPIIGIVEQISSAFTDLSPAGQLLAGIFAAVAAAIGPVLVVVGTLAVGIGSVVSAIGTIAGAVAAIGGVGPILLIVGAALAQVAIVGAIVAAVAGAIYSAWQSNFGNIQGIVTVFQSQIKEAFAGLMSVIQPAIDEVSKYAVEGFNQIKNWWSTDGKIISQAAGTIFGNMLATVQSTLNAISAFWQTHGESIKAIVSATWNIVKTIITGVVSAIGNSIKLAAQLINGDWAGAWETFKTIVMNAGQSMTAFLRGLGNLILAALKFAFETGLSVLNWAVTQFVGMGKSLVEGLIKGIVSGASAVGSAISNLANSAISTAKSALGIASPSKVFFGIGKDVVQGFIDGINALRASAQSAMASLLDVSNLKTKKTDKAGVELLTQLTNEITRFGVEGKLANVMLDLTADKFIKLNPQIREAVLTAAAYIDQLKAQKEAQDKINEATKKASDELGKLVEAYLAVPVSKLAEIDALLANPATSAELEKRASALGLTVEYLKQYLRLSASLADESKQPFSTDGTGAKTRTDSGLIITNPNQTVEVDGSIEPEIKPKSWTQTIFGSMSEGLQRLQQSLPPLKQQLSDIFLDLPGRATDVLGTALQNWDGTFKGFFKSIGQSFGQLITQLINELLRMVIVQAIMKIVGSMFGGGFGGKGIGNLTDSLKGIGSGAAMGGLSFAAEGGYFNAGEPVVVGEKGWEVFIPGTNGTVVNQEQLGKLGGKKQTINNININASRSDSLATPKSRRQTAEAMASALRRYQ